MNGFHSFADSEKYFFFPKMKRLVSLSSIVALPIQTAGLDNRNSTSLIHSILIGSQTSRDLPIRKTSSGLKRCQFLNGFGSRDPENS